MLCSSTCNQNEILSISGDEVKAWCFTKTPTAECVWCNGFFQVRSVLIRHSKTPTASGRPDCISTRSACYCSRSIRLSATVARNSPTADSSFFSENLGSGSELVDDEFQNPDPAYTSAWAVDVGASPHFKIAGCPFGDCSRCFLTWGLSEGVIGGHHGARSRAKMKAFLGAWIIGDGDWIRRNCEANSMRLLLGRRRRLLRAEVLHEGRHAADGRVKAR
ncbi:hypothetical protein OPV22_000128 [Ensete ventricosum]|uniref:C2H2-type domain-containing protein n=1 Tax=Ensete ventricosum TaxID=4639 RepID=A0AAV8RV84_ENSVE|nr:hypothetical protein OPV22_000128 [Ensete ventricosum]